MKCKMDKTEKTLETYLLTNIDSMPPEVLNVILASLDPKTILNACLGNKKLKVLCSAKGELSVLNQAAIRYIAEQAPLSKPIRSLQEQASLLQRGCVTTYHFATDGNTSKLGFAQEVAFGAPTADPHEEYQSYVMEIRGLPPPKGTKVWICTETFNPHYEHDNHDEYPTIPHVEAFMTKQEAIDGFRSRSRGPHEGLDFQKFVKTMLEYPEDFEEEDEPVETVEDIIRLLEQRGIVSNLMLTELELP